MDQRADLVYRRGIPHAAIASTRRLPHRVDDRSKVLLVVRVFAGARGRWLAVAASVALASAMFYAQSNEKQCCVAAPAVSHAGQASVVPDAPRVVQPTEAELLAASAPVTSADFQLALPRGVAPEEGLQVHTVWVARAISVMFLEIKTIGGYRQDPLPWHPNGLAIDVMIPNFHTPTTATKPPTTTTMCISPPMVVDTRPDAKPISSGRCAPNRPNRNGKRAADFVCSLGRAVAGGGGCADGL